MPIYTSCSNWYWDLPKNKVDINNCEVENIFSEGEFYLHLCEKLSIEPYSFIIDN
jgi:hypothetical protein